MKIDFPVFMLCEDETFNPYFLATANESQLAWPLFEKLEEAIEFSRLIHKTLLANEYVNAKNLLKFMDGTRPDRLSHVLRGGPMEKLDTLMSHFAIRETADVFFQQLRSQADAESRSAYN